MPQLNRAKLTALVDKDAALKETVATNLTRWMRAVQPAALTKQWLLGALESHRRTHDSTLQTSSHRHPAA